MRFSHFFIRRPIFAGVIAIIITIVGLFAYFGLPVSQFPNVVPPTVTVSANYPGASAETVAAKPVETGPLVGDLRVVRSGLTRADRVVIQGVQFAMPGSKVKPRVTQIRVADGVAPTAAPPSSPSASQATLAAR